MYKQIQIEFQPAFIPVLAAEGVSCNFTTSTYYIRGLFSYGHFPVTSFYARLGGLVVDGSIRHLSVYYPVGCERHDRVFVFDADNCLGVIRMISRINDACIKGLVQPLPDMEFVHPAAHALLYSLGGFSGSSADCYLSADPNAVDLNQKVR